MILLRIWAVTAAFLAVAVTRSLVVGIPIRDPGGAFLISRVALTAGLFACFVVIEGVWRAPRGDRTVATVGSAIRSRWTRARLVGAWGALLAYHMAYLSYHNLKSWDVLNAPRDHALTAVDRWLFAGHSPAVLLHDVLGQHLAAYALILIYEAFPTLVVLVVAGSVFTPRLRDGQTVLAALIWVWILGTVTYYAVPSLGPFSDRPQDFAGLPHTIVTDTQALYLAQRAHLLADPQAPDAFAQVSAFASLHVGVTTVITLMAARLGYRRTARALWLFLALTCVATVYLGWHFAVDVPAGLAIGWLAVLLGAWTVGGSSGRDGAGDEGDHQGAREHRAVPDERREAVGPHEPEQPGDRGE
ncbi:MAG TPA: phosphatase PAP2 family protein [Nocardioides sp.]|uniref:phosphatase PAP2 family protein n=1 Tax=uncultured Nocardioides sp. TaxID=198441 RepID=UPI002614B2C1|nr:phosphatase PAP2 family protein [uncultured Nocardioides sp.]HRD61062.1 phosphatase PAP2 family protein [Nocardioides sp.]HRI96093.1 phosphatase PAP2 family protein [Nocardioides sp.]